MSTGTRSKRCTVGLLTALGLLLGGCPMQAQQSAVLDIAAGEYWVEHDGGALHLLAFPESRASKPAWLNFNMALPEWYVGTGFYQLGDDGDWMVIERGDADTLDSFIQVYDPAPAVE